MACLICDVQTGGAFRPGNMPWGLCQEMDCESQVETYFRIMWAEHGDDISFQYAGTGALKSGFTRTGVRTKSGLVDDGVKSAKRYYLNNFQDGHKQDAIDLVTGNYVVSKGE